MTLPLVALVRFQRHAAMPHPEGLGWSGRGGWFHAE